MSHTTYPQALAQKGSLFRSILLICGSSIGAGILSLPILTGQAGSLPTLAIFILCWLFMSATALLLLESSLIHSDNKNFISLAKSTLNRFGQTAVFLSFIFLFYSLTTAYLAKGGELIGQFMQTYSAQPLPTFTGASTLALISGALIFFGPFIVDHINRIFMAGFFLTYLFLTFSGVEHFQLANIQHADWSYSLFIVPFIVTSFGYHNMIPSIRSYLGTDRKKLYQTILYSGLILFFVYSLWVIMMHGILPLPTLTASFANGEIATQPLSLLISTPAIQYSAAYMAFFAIITSLLGQGLSIIDFLSDTLRIPKTAPTRLALCLALFIPTLLCSQLIPGVFFKALELVGGIAAMILFGIIPALLGYVHRYRRPHPAFRPLVPGGKPMLLTIISLATLVITYELAKNLIKI